MSVYGRMAHQAKCLVFHTAVAKSSCCHDNMCVVAAVASCLLLVFIAVNFADHGCDGYVLS